MENLVKIKENYYYKKKLRNRENLVISLKTDSKREAKELTLAIKSALAFDFVLEKEKIKDKIQNLISELKLKIAHNRTETALKLQNNLKSISNLALSQNELKLSLKEFSAKEDLELKENIAHNRSETPLKLKNSLKVIPNLTLRQKEPTNQFYDKTIKELIEIFKEQKQKENLKEKNRYEKILNQFQEMISKEYLIDITAKDFLDFVNDFSSLPNENIRENKEKLKGKSYKEWIELSKEYDMEKVSDKTTKDKLIRINAFLNFCVSLEYLDKNRMNFKIKVSENNIRKSYKKEQIEKLFNSKWYKEELENNLKNAPEKVFIPLILLHTGARINEISQLHLNQILEKNGVNFFKISADFENQKLKNSSSKREIPIHKVLEDFGFLDYVKLQKMKQKPNENLRLFSNLYHTKGKGYGQNFSKIFNDFKQNFLEKETIERIKSKEILLDLHSFRHTFSTAARGKIDENDLSFILGHSKNQTQKYGEMPLKILKEKIDKINYELQITELKERVKGFYQKAVNDI